MSDRLIPDSECKQGKCGATTTGCIGKCALDYQSSIVLVDSATNDRKIAELERQLSAANAAIAMKDKALKEIAERNYVDITRAEPYKSALSTYPESIAAWEAEKLLPLQRQVAMQAEALKTIHDEYCVAGYFSGAGAIKELISASSETVEAFMAEHDAKVLEEAKSNIETMNAQMRIDIQDVVDALQQMADECRASKQVKE